MRAVFALIAGFVALATPMPSLACKCAPAAAPADALREAVAVFEGRVVGQTPGEQDVEVSFSVVQAWKGVQAERVRVRTRKDSAACGIEFSGGESYLVYATRNAGEGAGDALWALRCGRTRPAAEASDDYAQLGVGVVPVSLRESGGRTGSGEPDQTKPEQAPAGGATKPQPLAPSAGGCASCAARGGTPASDGWAALACAALGSMLFARSRKKAPRAGARGATSSRRLSP